MTAFFSRLSEVKTGFLNWYKSLTHCTPPAQSVCKLSLEECSLLHFFPIPHYFWQSIFIIQTIRLSFYFIFPCIHVALETLVIFLNHSFTCIKQNFLEGIPKTWHQCGPLGWAGSREGFQMVLKSPVKLGRALMVNIIMASSI